MATSESALLEQLVGTWRLLSVETVGPEGSVGYPLGEQVVGQLMYGANRMMSVHTLTANRPRLTNDDVESVGIEELRSAWKSYTGYYGPFSIDAEASIVTHHVEDSSSPHLAHTDQPRHFRLKGNRLLLDAPVSNGQIYVVWEKIG